MKCLKLWELQREVIVIYSWKISHEKFWTTVVQKQESKPIFHYFLDQIEGNQVDFTRWSVSMDKT